MFTTWNSLPEVVRRAVYVGVTVVAVLLLLRWLWSNEGTTHNHRVAALVQQAAQWGVAAEQDEDPLVALTHANYAAAYLQVLHELYGDSMLRIAELQTKIDVIQVGAHQRASAATHM